MFWISKEEFKEIEAVIDEAGENDHLFDEARFGCLSSDELLKIKDKKEIKIESNGRRDFLKSIFYPFTYSRIK